MKLFVNPPPRALASLSNLSLFTFQSVHLIALVAYSSGNKFLTFHFTFRILFSSQTDDCFLNIFSLKSDFSR